jgi:soluble lytic murein transglycosylase-like protein
MNVPFTVLITLGFTFAVPSTRDAVSSTFTPVQLEKPVSRAPFDTQRLIRAMAEKYHVPAEFVKSIVAAESNFNSDAVSAKGAIGLMQLMPDTAREWGGDPTVPEQNIEAGTRYLSFLMNHYRKSRKPLSCAIAAYNAGPGAVDHYHGVPPFRETQGYVTRVLAFLQRFQREGRRGASARRPERPRRAGAALVAEAKGNLGQNPDE